MFDECASAESYLCCSGCGLTVHIGLVENNNVHQFDSEKNDRYIECRAFEVSYDTGEVMCGVYETEDLEDETCSRQEKL